jgi:heptosyltransferase-1
MGDVLHAMPAVAALRELHPEWFIGWAIEPGWSELLEATGTAHTKGRNAARPLVDTWHSVPAKAWKERPLSLPTISGINAMRQELRGSKYDLCVDMQGSLKSAVVGRMSGTKVFVGPAEPREAPARGLYRQHVMTRAAHVVDQGCELLGEAIGETLHPAKVTLPVDPAAEQWCDEALAGIGKRFALMAPTAGWGAKQWPAERYAAVAARLEEAGIKTVVNAASSEDAIAGRVVAANGGAAVSVPCSVGQLIAMMRRAAVVIAGDTGPLHLAAALGRPVVGLYGPTDPARNGPYRTNARVLRHESSVTDHSRKAETEAGLMRITTDEVVEAALGLLRGEQDKVVE